FATAADVLLNLPVLKTHALTLLTGSIKNLFGIVTGTQKARLHVHAPGAAQFAELLVDIFQAVPVPVLTIMDAILGMDGQSGPGAGRTLRIGRLITGRSAVAVDTVMAAMAGARPGDIPFLRHAGSRGLGPTDPAAIDVVGDFAPVRGFRLPSAALAAHAGGIASVAYHFIQRRPVLDRRLCTRCQRCVSSCPVGAITAAPFPRIDRHRCITCYCCAETCPAKALSVPGLLRGVVQYFTGR
ncbi:DUF362 domain-containing protein, partial [candidate division WOR-3 bacterium]|nr:DUF362 domain-containing protein [candidate division WOR-3 bacterium]